MASPPTPVAALLEPPKRSPCRTAFRGDVVGRRFVEPPTAGPAGRLVAALIPLGGLTAVSFIGLLDYYTIPHLSFALFYLIPIAAAAWWGGFANGILLALASTVAWYLVDASIGMPDHLAIVLWNGVVRFGTFVITASLLSRLRISMSQEQVLARTDALTGAMNSRTFYETLTVEAERARRTGQPLSLAYLDLDNFKQLNDRLGHFAGDEALFYVVRTIRQNLRISDQVARLGGDEFGLLLPNTGAPGAIALLTGLQRFLSQEMARKGWPVTVSIGAATFSEPPRRVELLVRRVDELMYRVKKSGKNRVDHEIVQELPAGSGSGWAEDRRSAVRIPCHRPARVAVDENGQFQDEVATVRDISCSGVGLHLGRELAPGTLLTIESHNGDGPKILIARVVRSAPRDGGWFHGCELSWPLSIQDLHSWLGEAANETLC